VACCDIAVATQRVAFCLSEVKLGLIPAVISPYVIAAIGQRAARRYFQSAEVFDAAEAFRLGLVHQVVAGENELAATVETIAGKLLINGPAAMAAAKRLVADVAGRPVDGTLITGTAERIAERRASEEGREGLSAFLEKRAPAWTGRQS